MSARSSSANPMSRPVRGLLATLAALMVLALACHTAAAMQLSETDQRSSAPLASLALVENPEITARVLESLLRSVVYSTAPEAQPFSNHRHLNLCKPISGAQKRGLDLGISRGYSGSQAGKHLMGLSAASFANGPGKR